MEDQEFSLVGIYLWVLCYHTQTKPTWYRKEIKNMISSQPVRSQNLSSPSSMEPNLVHKNMFQLESKFLFLLGFKLTSTSLVTPRLRVHIHCGQKDQIYIVQ